MIRMIQEFCTVQLVCVNTAQTSEFKVRQANVQEDRNLKTTGTEGLSHSSMENGCQRFKILLSMFGALYAF